MAGSFPGVPSGRIFYGEKVLRQSIFIRVVHKNSNGRNPSSTFYTRKWRKSQKKIKFITELELRLA